MNIQTDRLLLRPWAESEAEGFFELMQDEGVHRFQITDYRQQSLRTAQAWVRENLVRQRETQLGKCGVWVKSTNELIGMGGLTPWDETGESLVDLTYRLRTAAWGKGFGSEVATALIRHGFEDLGLSQITATITPDNIPSIRLAEKLGFKFDSQILLLGVKTNFYRLRRSQ